MTGMGLTDGHKFCLLLLIVGAAALATGSVAPYWLTLNVAGAKAAFGLWYTCGSISSTDHKCDHYEWKSSSASDFSKYFYIVHVAAGLATLLSSLVMLLALCKMIGKRNGAKSVGGIALISGLLGIAAFVIFHLKTVSSLALQLPLSGDTDWAFYVFAVGASVQVFFGFILMVLPNHNSVQPTI